MTAAEQQPEAGNQPRLVRLTPAVPAERMLANMRASIARGLPVVTPCRAHGLTLSVAGGGPSLADTWPELTGAIGCVNGSLKYLIEPERIISGASYLCAILDAGEHIADMIVADQKVRYYVASVCDPLVFDKLKDCDVRLWHITPQSMVDSDGATALLDEAYPDGWHAIGGGCTMGLRWINLGYFLGFRSFKLHGLDSSFRDGATHAYPDRADTKDRIEFCGRLTRPNFLAQLYDFFGTLNLFCSGFAFDPVEIEVFGDGLLQDQYREWKADQRDLPLIACVKQGSKYGPEYVTRLRDGVARHLSRPHRFVCFTDDPVEGVECHPLPADLPGYWSKMGLFKLKRPLLYFDLDVVITGDLAPLLDWEGFGVLRDWWLPMFNSSVMKLTGKESHVWDAFALDADQSMRACRYGDQQFVTLALPDARVFPPEYCPSYKADRCQDAPPKGARVVVMHGEPKPHQCGGWVAEAWCQTTSTETVTA